MILDSYYYFVRSNGKSKTRLDAIISTSNYEPFENLSNSRGELFMYVTDAWHNFKVDPKRRADKSLTSKSQNISSVYVPDLNLPLGYGDVKDTTDALLFIFDEQFTFLEILIAQGNRNNKLALYHMLCNGQLDIEVEALKKKAKNRETASANC